MTYSCDNIICAILATSALSLRVIAVVHLITYDLKTPNDTPQDYERIITWIKQTSATWCHLEKSVWVVESAMDATEWRDSLKSALYPNDLLFVARLHGNWATWNLGDERNRWLHNRSF